MSNTVGCAQSGARPSVAPAPEGPLWAPICQPPESDVLAMLVVLLVILGGGWLIRRVRARHKRPQ